MDKISRLALNITKTSSIQTYYTIKFLVDKHLIYDCFKAYAYFRWIDDQVDEYIKNKKERIKFITRQKKIIQYSYLQKKLTDLSPEEKIISDLIKTDNSKNSKLKSYITNFFKIIEFDAKRKSKKITGKQLDWYATTLGRAVTDGILYFIGNHHVYRSADNQYLAAKGACIAHMLRDLRYDIPEGYINIPEEYLTKYQLDPTDTDNPIYINWVKDQVKLARDYFHEGKKYISSLPVLKCKIAAYCYCARFESILDNIEIDNYLLRLNYTKNKGIHARLRFVGIATSTAIKHLFQKFNYSY